jgi:TolB-like protein/Tfp pilus assembly protein PilF
MADTSSGPGEADTVADRLDSWKEIAAYLRRGLATVQRWEKQEGLPVHRHLHGRLGSVYGYRGEIDAWWRERSARLAAPDEPPRGGPGWLSRRSVLAVAATMASALVVALLAVSIERTPSSAERRPSAGKVMLAVLPFEDLGGDPQQDYFSEGLTEEMITDVALLHPDQLGVIARTSVMRYKGTDKAVAQIGKELGVAYLLEGSVRRSGSRVRVVAQLIEVRGQTHLWAQTYDRDVTDAIDIQKDVAERVAASLALKLLPGSGRGSARPANAAAYEGYLKGRYFWNKRSGAGLRKAIEYFEAAIDADPRYALAHAGLADAYALAGSGDYAVLPPRKAMPRAQAAASRALELDETLAEAHASLGWIHLAFDWDWSAAEREFRRALELNPGYATAHQWYAYFLSAMERHEEAISQIEQARQLDPLSIIVNQDVGVILSIAGRYDQALWQYQKTLEMDGGFAVTHWYRGLAWEDQGQYDRAIAAFERALTLEDTTAYRAGLAHAYAASGRRADALRILDQLKALSPRQYVASFDLALIHAALGQNDDAFSMLEHAYEQREEAMPYLKVERRFAPIRRDPRFAAMVRRLGLVP